MDNGLLKIGQDEYRILFSQEMIMKKVDELAGKIAADFRSEEVPPILMLVLTGGLYFGTDMSKALDRICFCHHIDTIGLKSYSADGCGGSVEIISRPHADLGGRHIIVVEDVIDRGVTMNFLDSFLKCLPVPPRSVTYSALCVKEEHGPLSFTIRYPGFLLSEKGWIVGYGMDSSQSYRGLTDIYVKN